MIAGAIIIIFAGLEGFREGYYAQNLRSYKAGFNPSIDRYRKMVNVILFLIIGSILSWKVVPHLQLPQVTFWFLALCSRWFLLDTLSYLIRGLKATHIGSGRLDNWFRRFNISGTLLLILKISLFMTALTLFMVIVEK
ncbi:MAG: hypothetical protein LPK80_09130 [Bacteroidota bacterium]|nr:hypothetical protein [Bacteroidota bacterium]